MLERHYLTKMLINSAGQDAPSIDVYETFESALIAYHNILAAYHNASDVQYAVVEIVNQYGNIEKMEVVNHIPAPEPEPEPEPKTIVSVEDNGDSYTITYSDGTIEIFEKSEESEPEENPIPEGE